MHSPVVLGLDFGGTKIAAAVCDLDGTRLGATTTHVRPADSATTTFHRGLTAAHGLLERSAPGRTLAAVGACTFGIPSDTAVRLAPTIPGWEELAFGAELQRAFPDTPVTIANDVKAAAAAEARSGALVDCDPAIYVNLGTGLAVAIIANGAVIDGKDGAAGEVGYNLRQLADVGVAAGSRTLLEQSISGQALLATSAGPPPSIVAISADFVAELAFHLVNLAIAINPVRIAVGGGMVRSWSQLEDGLRAALTAAVPFPPELVVAKFPFDAPLLGALELGRAAAHELHSQVTPA